MNPVLYVFIYNIIPIFILISVGIFMGKKFKLDINTLTKLNFYVFVPIFSFTKLYTTEIGQDQVKVLLYATVQVVALACIAALVSKLRGHDRNLSKVFQNAVMFFNSGNIGVPLITLVFSTGIYMVDRDTPWADLAVTTQIMMLLVQNITTNTIGFYNASIANGSVKEAIKKVFSMPSVYAIPAAILLKLVPIDLTQSFFWPALTYCGNALISIALITLGVQLTRTKLSFNNKEAWIAVVLRLLGGPAVSYGLIVLFGFTGVVARALLIASAVPTAVNTALIAVECDNSADFASQVVLATTVLCSISLLLVINLSTVLFPM